MKKDKSHRNSLLGLGYTFFDGRKYISRKHLKNRWTSPEIQSKDFKSTKVTFQTSTPSLTRSNKRSTSFRKFMVLMSLK